MNSTSKTIETNRVELTITITASEFAKGLDTAFEKVRKDVTVEGFRKGKIPRRMFENKFGVEVLYDDALNLVLPDAYREAIKTEEIHPIDFPEWDVKELSKADGVVAIATIWVKPTVELGEYKGLSVTRLSDEVTDEDIEAEINKLAAGQSEMIIKEGPAAIGDIAVIDYEGFKEEKAFEGGKGENHPLELGSNSFIPGFEEKVVGMSAGDEKDIDLTFPADYHATELAGAAVVFKVKVHEVKMRELPEIDDDFVIDLDQDGIETIAELRASILEKLTETKKADAEAHVINSVIEQAVANASFEVPDVMVENEITNMVKRMEQQYKQQGFTLEMYLQFSGLTMEELRKQMKQQAIKSVDQSIVIDAIIEKENIDVTDEDLEEELAKMAESYDMEIDKMKAMIPDLSMLKADIKSRKTIDMMTESAV